MSISFKKKHLYAVAALILLVVIGGLIAYKAFLSPKPLTPGAYLTENGLMKLPQRESVRYEVAPLAMEDNANYTIHPMFYESAGMDIHGLLLEPKREGKVPGVVLLAGAGVDKKSELPVARSIASLGYAVLVIDQRGIGETGGGLPPLEADFENFKKGVVAQWHLPVIDALIAADALGTRDSVDANNIILMGESMGGRTAIIAAAIDPRMKGVIAISSAGFHYQDEYDELKNLFLRSLDADNYMPKIAPRPIIMIHSVWDKTIPLKSAALTFEKAGQPKLFVTVNATECAHGYCEAMLKPLNYSLSAIIAGRQ